MNKDDRQIWEALFDRKILHQTIRVFKNYNLVNKLKF
jgi:hypothetical protein